MSSRLHFIAFLSLPAFALHGYEEYLTGFTKIDPIFLWVFKPLLLLPVEQATFVVFQIMIALLLMVAGLLLLGEQWQRKVLALLGIVYLFEFHHFIEAIRYQSYYPGLVTALAFPALAYYFWKEYFSKQHL